MNLGSMFTSRTAGKKVLEALRGTWMRHGSRRSESQRETHRRADSDSDGQGEINGEIDLNQDKVNDQ